MCNCLTREERNERYYRALDLFLTQYGWEYYYSLCNVFKSIGTSIPFLYEVGLFDPQTSEERWWEPKDFWSRVNCLLFAIEMSE
jgi:hypothetical protein